MKPRHYIREWRLHRGLTMADLAERMGASRAIVSRVERGEQRYNQDLLERAAAALGVTPVDLLVRDPALAAEDIYAVWAELEPEKREIALTVLRALLDRGGGGR